VLYNTVWKYGIVVMVTLLFRTLMMLMNLRTLLALMLDCLCYD